MAPRRTNSAPTNERCRAPPLAQRVLAAEPDAWHAAAAASDRPLPTFYLHDSGACNFSVVRHGLRSFIGDRLAEEVVPIAFSQYLVDLPLIEALEDHPRRVRDPSAADWHVLAAMPFASRLWGLLESNVSADGGRCCEPSGACPKCTQSIPRGVRRHEARLAALISYLDASSWWRRPGVPFLLLSTGISISIDLYPPLLGALLRRNARVGPVILGGVDRSGLHANQPVNLPLLRRMVVLPHVATPECAAHASLCAGEGAAGAGRRRRRKDGLRALVGRPAAAGHAHSPVLAAALAHGTCRLPAAAPSSGAAPAEGADGAPAAIEYEAGLGAAGAGAKSVLSGVGEPADPAQAPWWASLGGAAAAARGRAGFVFHGDHGRYAQRGC